MPTSPVPEGRRFKRIPLKKPVSLVMNLAGYEDFGRHEERHPCLILDSSQNGFRLRAAVRLRPGKVVEVILDGDTVQCIVVWVGKIGSQNQDEAGLQVCSR